MEKLEESVNNVVTSRSNAKAASSGRVDNPHADHGSTPAQRIPRAPSVIPKRRCKGSVAMEDVTMGRTCVCGCLLLLLLLLWARNDAARPRATPCAAASAGRRRLTHTAACRHRPPLDVPQPVARAGRGRRGRGRRPGRRGGWRPHGAAGWCQWRPGPVSRPVTPGCSPQGAAGEGRGDTRPTRGQGHGAEPQHHPEAQAQGQLRYGRPTRAASVRVLRARVARLSCAA